MSITQETRRRQMNHGKKRGKEIEAEIYPKIQDMHKHTHTSRAADVVITNSEPSQRNKRVVGQRTHNSTGT